LAQYRERGSGRRGQGRRAADADPAGRAGFPGGRRRLAGLEGRVPRRSEGRIQAVSHPQPPGHRRRGRGGPGAVRAGRTRRPGVDRGRGRVDPRAGRMMADTAQANAPWQLEPVSAAARLWLLALVVLLPMGIVVGALAFTANDPGPKRLIAGNEPLTIAIVVAGTLLLCMAIHWAIARSLRRHDVVAGDAGLEVRTT